MRAFSAPDVRSGTFANQVSSSALFVFSVRSYGDPAAQALWDFALAAIWAPFDQVARRMAALLLG
jgi:hypothetical protein